MCGFAGVRLFDETEIDIDALSGMASTLLHRGPDEQSTWTEPGLGLAHTRLSIIDVQGSHQPMHSADGTWVIVFNGEVFNYRELRAKLDYPFETDGDTEVILAGLCKKGIGFVSELRGQFAFAAFERSTGILHLVRDRLGILPLYYSAENGRVTFASEPKAIFAAGGRTPTVDRLSLDAYLASRSVPAPNTLYAGIKKVLPGHRCAIDRNGNISFAQYWAPPAVAPQPRTGQRDVVGTVDLAIRDAVEAALVADVPIGSYLSGGVDSSLIVAVMKSLRGDAPVETFAAGFGDPRYDELRWARLVSEHVGTTHHEVHVRADDFEELWPRMTWHRDAPISEPADIAVFRLAEMARRHVTVVLSGEGGDELFAGYPKYRLARALRVARTVPASLRARFVNALEPRLPQRLSRARIALRAAGAPTEADQLASWFAPFTAIERQVLIGSPPPRERLRTTLPGDDSVDRMLRYDLASWLPDNLLERGDRMSMAASLELRPPLLDHRLVELAFRLPSSVKLRRGTTKWALKEVAKRYLPEEIVERRKVGFRVPLDDWFRKGLRDAMWDRLTGTSSFVGSNFNKLAVRELLTRHENGLYNEESRIWTLMSLEVWHNTCVAGTAGSVE